MPQRRMQPGTKREFERLAGRISRLVAAAFLVCALACPEAARALTLNERTALDWLVKSVCVSANDRALPIDPYAGCGSNGTLRKIRIGEALPYSNREKPLAGKPGGFIIKDNVPTFDRDGKVAVVSPIDWADRGATGVFTPSRDGFDIMSIRHGWVLLLETRSRAELNTVFFGEGCQYDTGTVFFPLNRDLTSGEVPRSVLGGFWEQQGENWPGKCDAGKLARNVLTTWRYLPAFQFDGDGTPKTLDTIEVTIGFRDLEAFRTGGHLETFYFTKLYGLTRWEGWAPAQQNKPLPDPTRCQGQKERDYHGVKFTLSDCRDYSATTVLPSSIEVPAWPASDLNLLDNFHFGDGLRGWQAAGEGAVEVGRSRLQIDIARTPGSKGLSYLRWGARGGPASLTQELPAERLRDGTYNVGLMARTEMGAGKMTVLVEQLDADRRSVSQQLVTFDLTDHDYSGHFTGKDSLAYASQFVSSPVKIAINRERTRTVAFRIKPAADASYQLFSAWLMRRAPAQ